jgi:phosphoribosyl 1,2-cyclic phosphodiesterase
MGVASIKFWGVRGSIASPGRKTAITGGNTSCVEICHGGQEIICDAGTGIRALGKDLKSRFADEPICASILLSHMHIDHLTGLPFFGPVHEKASHIDIYCPRIMGKSCTKFLEIIMSPPFFPKSIKKWQSTINFIDVCGEKFKIGDIEVETHRMNHPDYSIGYKFRFNDGKSVVYVSDNDISCADKDIFQWLYGADVAIHDAQYDSRRHGRQGGFGHSVYEEVVVFMAKAHVKTLCLFHFDPDADDEGIRKMHIMANALVKKEKSKMKCLTAREGACLKL